MDFLKLFKKDTSNETLIMNQIQVETLHERFEPLTLVTKVEQKSFIFDDQETYEVHIAMKDAGHDISKQVLKVCKNILGPSNYAKNSNRYDLGNGFFSFMQYVCRSTSVKLSELYFPSEDKYAWGIGSRSQKELTKERLETLTAPRSYSFLYRNARGEVRLHHGRVSEVKDNHFNIVYEDFVKSFRYDRVVSSPSYRIVNLHESVWVFTMKFEKHGWSKDAIISLTPYGEMLREREVM